MNKKASVYFLLFLVFAAVAFFIEQAASPEDYYLQQTREFQKDIDKKEERLREELLALQRQLSEKSYSQVLLNNQKRFASLSHSEGISFFVFEEDTLRLWSDNSAPVPEFYNKQEFDRSLVKLENGWYLTVKWTEKNKQYLGLALIKNEYPHTNRYLVNRFQQDFNIENEAQLAGESSGFPVPFSVAGKPAGYLVFPKPESGSGSGGYLFKEERGFLLILLHLLALPFLILSAHAVYLRLRHLGHAVALFGLLFALFVLRFLMVELKYPAALYHTELFSPAWYATSFFFSSLGDFLINALLFCYVAVLIGSYARRVGEPLKADKTAKAKLTGVLFLILSLAAFAFAIAGVKSLVEHSGISLNINNIFTLNWAGYVALLIIGLLFLSACLLGYRILGEAAVLMGQKNVLFAAGGIVFVSYAAAQIVESSRAEIFLWLLPGTASIFLINRAAVRSERLSGILLLLIALSACATHIVDKYSAIKEKEGRMVLAAKLASENDPLAEFLYINLEDKITEDKKLRQLFNDYFTNSQEINNYIRDKYFAGFWEKYTLQVSVCKASDLLLITPDNIKVSCLEYFDSLLQHKGRKVDKAEFYFMENNSGRISYTGKIIIPGKEPLNVILELNSKFIPEGSGYPELLLDMSSIRQSPNRLDYSFARYSRGQLISSAGKYSYRLKAGGIFNDNEQKFVEQNGFSHLIYPAGSNSGLILSRPQRTFFEAVTTFSYLFVAFSLLVLAVVVVKLKAGGIIAFWKSFRGRLQVLLVAVVVTSLLLFGAGTIYYIRAQYNNKNNKVISEKLRSVLIELEGKLGNEAALTPQMADYITFYLVKFSNVFFTDLNLYNEKGSLLASSRAEVFDIGLLSRKMAPKAYAEMAIRNKTEFIHQEKAGNLKYLSAYVPFRNEEGKVLAYLNLPHFAKQTELENEISFFLVALINIYVLLFILSIMAAIFISNYVTAPLNLIRGKLRNVTLGRSNELIEWKGKDEIGGLVNEYNRMVLELAESADRLARSERESAWREMAKQVAHEIKNPLTPIKLSAQHLQRAWKDKAPDFDQKLERFTSMLIEQSETLSKIADEFSGFAQMPKPDFEKVNIEEVAAVAVDMYRETPGITVDFSSKAPQPPFVYADKDHLLRILNNLIKNAIQAIPEGRKGQVIVQIEEQGKTILLSVKDNGTGISDEQKDKIFAPNFTTKSSGMGLGLAMVKSMMEMAGGKIWFKTAPGEGSTFFIEFPEVKE